MDRREEIIKQKIDDVFEMKDSEELEKAKLLVTEYNKLCDDIKEYCKEKGMHELNGHKYKVVFKVTKQSRIDNNLIEKKIRELARVPMDIWKGFYEKQ